MIASRKVITAERPAGFDAQRRAKPRPRNPLRGLALSRITAGGQVVEWLKAPHSKCGVRASVPWVRIPPCPPVLSGRAHGDFGSMSGKMTEPRQIRILHVFRFFRPKFTGEGIFVERLAPHFALARPDVIHDVAVTVTPEPKGGMTLPHLGEIHYLAKTETPDGASQAEIVRWMMRHGRRYDVVHYHAHADRTFLGAWFLKLMGRRTVQSAT